MRLLQVGEENHPHPQITLAENQTSPLHEHLTLKVPGEGNELLGGGSLRPSQDDLTRYTLPPPPRCPRGRAHTPRYSLFKTFMFRHSIG
jgi:hypothetical protein